MSTSKTTIALTAASACGHQFRNLMPATARSLSDRFRVGFTISTRAQLEPDRLLPPYRISGLSPLLRQPPNDERTHFGNAIKVTIDVNHTQVVVEGRLSDQQVRDRSAMPHAVVVREVLL